MERNENGLSSLLHRTNTVHCFNAGGNTGNGNTSNGNTGNGGIGNGGSVGGVTDSEQNGGGGCGCRDNGSRQLAMVYSPMQCWRMLHAPDEALMKGTLFEELYKPYEEVW